jgi:hypothetical protein
MDSIEKRVDDFLLVEVATFERQNRGRQTSELIADRNALAHKWDSLCRELRRRLLPGTDRNEVESRLVAAGAVVTEWWDYGWNVTANDLAEFLERLRSHADALARLWEELKLRAADTRPAKGGEVSSVDIRAVGAMLEHPEFTTIKQIAKSIGTNPKYLSSDAVPKFKAAWAAKKSAQRQPRRGSKSVDGTLEATGDEDLDFDEIDRRNRKPR